MKTAHFSLLIKPASADCNMNCKYCFYIGHQSFYPSPPHRMTHETLEKLVSSYLGTRQMQYVFIWQGGEPTLMGIDFFRHAVELQKKYGDPLNAVISNAMQTNGILISDEIAEFFARYRFLLGVSLDGPVDIHNRYRVSAGGSGSHSDVLRGIDRLKKHKVDFNAMILVSKANVHEATEVYRYLVDNDLLFHQYTPCVEWGENGYIEPFSIGADEWGDFLCELFDEWYPHDTRRVSIRLFDSVVNYLVDGVRTICHMGSDCRQYFVVEYNGDVYPCDFFVRRELLLGNITKDTWPAMQCSPVYSGFGRLKKQWNESCNKCEWLRLCAGDCIKHRAAGGDDKAHVLSSLCRGWKKFYEYTTPRFKILAEEIKQERKARVEQPGSSGKIRPGRNEPCPCGSGKKYKKCCGV